ncbi:hypothetical protein ACIQH6_28385 [Micromonospora orduensis]|uniref:hypothetical protein n=1 Tax=Micromonospora orduensis TaxID=1420891 RepID=UPI00382FF136
MDPAGMARMRLKLYSFALVAVAGIAVDAPLWSVLASVFICVAIPFAVAAQGIGPVRALLLPSRGPHPDEARPPHTDRLTAEARR